eukprot:gene24096-9670_t
MASNTRQVAQNLDRHSRRADGEKLIPIGTRVSPALLPTCLPCPPRSAVVSRGCPGFEARLACVALTPLS